VKLQRFLSALVRLKSLFKARPLALPVETDYRDLLPKMETLP
jgi:hypothetical protein